uniref:Uncharacterized protein n=1 Tax=Opuntia streptacantha TaxID=393608 RepID=A0A7C9D0L6_OPUST
MYQVWFEFYSGQYPFEQYFGDHPPKKWATGSWDPLIRRSKAFAGSDVDWFRWHSEGLLRRDFRFHLECRSTTLAVIAGRNGNHRGMLVMNFDPVGTWSGAMLILCIGTYPWRGELPC